ncbi:hypothetical protein TIFTF001_038511 [Ficus carica]|uniref:Uncharacterized protein n=1 Tax=Ficus carica TaxID=3494 RepID=A0AA88EAN8_FICCA|nr:hypothetical protein TIFTF001_038511 [Ficus carica]
MMSLPDSFLPLLRFFLHSGLFPTSLIGEKAMQCDYAFAFDRTMRASLKL